MLAACCLSVVSAACCLSAKFVCMVAAHNVLQAGLCYKQCSYCKLCTGNSETQSVCADGMLPISCLQHLLSAVDLWYCCLMSVCGFCLHCVSRLSPAVCPMLRGCDCVTSGHNMHAGCPAFLMPIACTAQQSCLQSNSAWHMNRCQVRLSISEAE